jgi:hypothetical protein
MGAPTPPSAEELIDRLKAVDTNTLSATAAKMDDAARELVTAHGKINGLVIAMSAVWHGKDWQAWREHISSCIGKLEIADEALGAMARALREFVSAVDSARGQADIAGAFAVEVFKDPGDFDARIQAERFVQMAADTYHGAEKRVREDFWRLGDSAPVGKPALPGFPAMPGQSWWEGLLFGPAGFYSWRVGRNGQPMGYDEDGNLVPAHWGHPEFVEVQQMGFGGLLRAIPGLGRRVRVGPGASVKDLTKAFADDIAKSYAWRPDHIGRHIREWYGLPKDAPIPKWMNDEFLSKVATASAASGKVITESTRGGPMRSVLYFDQTTKRWLLVRYHAEGKYAGQFATAVRPSPAQVDRILRQGATVKGN